MHLDGETIGESVCMYACRAGKGKEKKKASDKLQ